MKLPKFLLATNEAALQGASFIIRTKPPLMIAQVLEFITHDDAEEFLKSSELIAYGKPYGYPVVVNYIGLLAPWDFKGSAQQQADKLAGVMKRMSDWYLYNYLKKG